MSRIPQRDTYICVSIGSPTLYLKLARMQLSSVLPAISAKLVRKQCELIPVRLQETLSVSWQLLEDTKMNWSTKTLGSSREDARELRTKPEIKTRTNEDCDLHENRTGPNGPWCRRSLDFTPGRRPIKKQTGPRNKHSAASDSPSVKELAINVLSRLRRMRIKKRTAASPHSEEGPHETQETSASIEKNCRERGINGFLWRNLDAHDTNELPSKYSEEIYSLTKCAHCGNEKENLEIHPDIGAVDRHLSFDTRHIIHKTVPVGHEEGEGSESDEIVEIIELEGAPNSGMKTDSFFRGKMPPRFKFIPSPYVLNMATEREDAAPPRRVQVSGVSKKIEFTSPENRKPNSYNFASPVGETGALCEAPSSDICEEYEEEKALKPVCIDSREGHSCYLCEGENSSDSSNNTDSVCSRSKKNYGTENLSSKLGCIMKNILSPAIQSSETPWDGPSEMPESEARDQEPSSHCEIDKYLNFLGDSEKPDGDMQSGKREGNGLYGALRRKSY